MRHQIIDVRCDHCNARASRPCRSVGDRVIVEPHQRRIQKALGKGWGADVDANLRHTAIMAYEKATLTFVFGRFSKDLLAAAKKHRSIDPRRKWVRDAFAGNVNDFHAEHFPKYSPLGAHGAVSCVQLELALIYAVPGAAAAPAPARRSLRRAA